VANAYGFCPLCGALGLARERRPNGNDRCAQGHVYPSHSAVLPVGPPPWAPAAPPPPAAAFRDAFQREVGEDHCAEWALECLDRVMAFTPGRLVVTDAMATRVCELIDVQDFDFVKGALEAYETIRGTP
jgi:hypothetical protein